MSSIIFMSNVLLRVDWHHLAQSVIVDLVHLLDQWSYTQVSVSIYDIKSSTSKVLLRVDSHHLAQPVIVDLGHLLHQPTYTQVSVSIYDQ
jgi:hypothetical protein